MGELNETLANLRRGPVVLTVAGGGNAAEERFARAG